MAKKILSFNLEHIKLLLLDVDGVMTDGGLYFSNSGDEKIQLPGWIRHS